MGAEVTLLADEAPVLPVPDPDGPVVDPVDVPVGTPVLDVVEPPAPGLTVRVVVGKIVVVMTVLDMIVVGPLKMSVFPSPNIAIGVAPEMLMTVLT